jgi:hypothetical protein
MTAFKLRETVLEEFVEIVQHYIATAKGKDGPLKLFALS